MCYLSIYSEALRELDAERPYLFLAGFAVIWVSSMTIQAILRKKR